MAQSSFALRVATFASCAATFGLAACSSDSVIPTAAPSASASRDAGGAPNGGDGSNGNNGNAFALGHVKVCAVPPAGEAACHSWITVDKGGQPVVTSTPTGYGPADLRPAYNYRHRWRRHGRDRRCVRRSQRGIGSGRLPQAVRLAGVHTVQRLLQEDQPERRIDDAARQRRLGRGDFARPRHGQRHLPELQDPARGGELQLVRESGRGRSRGEHDGVVAISNSYGGGEYAGEVSDQSHYNHPSIAITVSSGDTGFGVEFPAASQYVTAVGGTHLTHSGSSTPKRSGTARAADAARISRSRRGNTTPAVRAGQWPTFQPSRIRIRASRSMTRTGSAGAVAVGWSSAARALPRRSSRRSTHSRTTRLPPNRFALLRRTWSLFDVTSGSNGRCGGSYLCTAVAGIRRTNGQRLPARHRGFLSRSLQIHERARHLAGPVSFSAQNSPTFPFTDAISFAGS